MFRRILLAFSVLLLSFPVARACNPVHGPYTPSVVADAVAAVKGVSVDVSSRVTATITNALQLAGGAIYDGVSAVNTGLDVLADFLYLTPTPPPPPLHAPYLGWEPDPNTPLLAYDPAAVVLNHRQNLPDVYKQGWRIDNAFGNSSAFVIGIPVDLEHVLSRDEFGDHYICDVPPMFGPWNLDASDATGLGSEDKKVDDTAVHARKWAAYVYASHLVVCSLNTNFVRIHAIEM